MNARDLKRLADGADVRSRTASDALELAAREQGILDVAVGTMDSPIGSLLLAVTDRGLVRVAFEGEDREAVLEELARRLSPRVLESAGATDQIRRELEEYFERRRRTFDVPVDYSLVRGFGATTLRAAAKIPYGSVRTYGDLAAQVGSPRAARAIGNALGANPIPVVVPCHRVLPAGGAVGGYGGGPERKKRLLQLEGFLRTPPATS
jgi:methylated-DNA-[protein]-cysteine S-methyltransferase